MNYKGKFIEFDKKRGVVWLLSDAYNPHIKATAELEWILGYLAKMWVNSEKYAKILSSDMMEEIKKLKKYLREIYEFFKLFGTPIIVCAKVKKKDYSNVEYYPCYCPIKFSIIDNVLVKIEVD